MRSIAEQMADEAAHAMRLLHAHDPAAHAALLRREAEAALLRVVEHAAAAPERRTVDCTIEFGGELEPPPNLLTADTKVLDDATMAALEDQAATRTFAERCAADVDALVIEAKRAFSAAKVGHEFEDMVRDVLAALGIEVRE